MPALMESTDYDLFDYNNVDEAPLSLDEALKKATALRAADKSRFHRIVPLDSTMSGFRIESVSREQVYADIVTRASELLNKFLKRARSR